MSGVTRIVTGERLSPVTVPFTLTCEVLSSAPSAGEPSATTGAGLHGGGAAPSNSTSSTARKSLQQPSPPLSNSIVADRIALARISIALVIGIEPPLGPNTIVVWPIKLVAPSKARITTVCAGSRKFPSKPAHTFIRLWSLLKRIVIGKPQNSEPQEHARR